MISKILKRSFSMITWGQNRLFEVNQDNISPVADFGQNIQQIASGFNLNAFVSNKNHLFLLSSYKRNQLSSKETCSPQKLYFHNESKQKITDIDCGGNHIVFCTGFIIQLEEGKVFQFGRMLFGLIDFIKNCKNYLLVSYPSHQFNEDPQLLSQIQGLKGVTAGLKFTSAYTQNRMFFIGNNRVIKYKYFQEISQIAQICKKQNATIVKAKSAGFRTTFLLSNGSLYSFGQSYEQAMGIRKHHKIVDDIHAFPPIKVITKNLKDQSIVDFELGYNTLVLRTDANRAYWCGIDHVGIPTLIQTEGKILDITALQNCVAVSTENGLFSVGQFVPQSKQIKFNFFKSKQVFSKIGGKYQCKWGIK